MQLLGRMIARVLLWCSISVNKSDKLVKVISQNLMHVCVAQTVPRFNILRVTGLR